MLYKGVLLENKININGYIEYYFPSHHRASSSGCVYEHILVMELIINRDLLGGEVIHHKNEVRNDNSPSNLMLFRSKADHTGYHNGLSIDFDSNMLHYYCPDLYKVYVCLLCGGRKARNAFICLNCYNKSKSKNDIDRDTLKDLIRKNTFTSIGTMYNVSDNAVKKWCKKFNLPFKKSDINLISEEDWAKL